jgi:hypothetical protein
MAWNRPQPLPAAMRAAPTAATGMRIRTASASTTRMPRLLGQRQRRATERGRRGARISHSAMAANIGTAAAMRMTRSIDELIGCYHAAHAAGSLIIGGRYRAAITSAWSPAVAARAVPC